MQKNYEINIKDEAELKCQDIPLHTAELVLIMEKMH